MGRFPGRLGSLCTGSGSDHEGYLSRPASLISSGWILARKFSTIPSTAAPVNRERGSVALSLDVLVDQCCSRFPAAEQRRAHTSGDSTAPYLELRSGPARYPVFHVAERDESVHGTVPPHGIGSRFGRTRRGRMGSATRHDEAVLPMANPFKFDSATRGFTSHNFEMGSSRVSTRSTIVSHVSFVLTHTRNSP